MQVNSRNAYILVAAVGLVLVATLVVVEIVCSGTGSAQVQMAIGSAAPEVAQGSVRETPKSGGSDSHPRQVETLVPTAAIHPLKPATAEVSDKLADDDEAVQAYRRAIACSKYLKFKAASLALDLDTQPEVSEQRLGRLDYALKFLTAHADECDGVTREHNQRRLFDTSLAAALSGDLQAQTCFVDGAFFGLHGGKRDGHAVPHQRYGPQAMVDRYFKFAPEFMHNAVDANHLRMVTLAAWMLLSREDEPPWKQQLPQPDPYRIYRALLLIDYRLVPGKSVQGLADEIADKYALTKKMTTQADVWARNMFQQSYGNRAITTLEFVSFCE